MVSTNRRSSGNENVRIGPLALFTLVSIVCLAVLAVLAVSTANATLALADRRATATNQLYLNETAAQTFLAALDESLSSGESPDTALQKASDAAREGTSADAPEKTEVSAERNGDTYTATFACGNGRQLNVTITWGEDGTYRIEQWRMTTVVNEEPPIGNLFGSSGP